MLYGSEIWNTIQTQMNRFEMFHQRCSRRILRIRWNYFVIVSHVEVLKRANIAPVDVLNSIFIRAARPRWFGHVARMPEDRIPNYLLHWVPKLGKRFRGRPRKNWLSYGYLCT